jgi:hypothetical protein
MVLLLKLNVYVLMLLDNDISEFVLKKHKDLQVFR